MGVKSITIIRYFLITWVAMNIVQAAFTELHYDESYYWVYSRFLDWGYYDHPPMVALFIKIGTLFTQSALGVRLSSIAANGAAIFILWKIAKRYATNAKLFIVLYSSMLILHVYSFITTPDTPLFLFTVLFYYFLNLYLREDKPKYVYSLGLIVACMMYSKYHAILVFLFTVIAHWQILKRRSFWLIAGISVILFLPHIYWQLVNGYPSLEYHLFDRTSRAYRFSFTTDFLLSQLLIVGPLTGVFLYYYVYKQQASDIFLRILKFNCFGFLLFFLLTSFKSRIEAHWTLLAFIPFFLLAYVYLAQLPKIPLGFRRLCYINIGLIVFIRFVLIFPIPALQQVKGLKQFWGKETFARQVNAAVGNEWLIMDNGFQDISNYNFTTNTTKGFSYNTRDYRKTQYDFWPIEDSLHHHHAYFASFRRHKTDKQDSINTNKGILYLLYIDSVRTYQKVQITAKGMEKRLAAGTSQRIALEIHNPYADTISFTNKGMKWPCAIEYGFTKHIFEQVDFKEISGNYRNIRIPPGGSTSLFATISMPEVPDDYTLVFSIRTAPFAGSRNSKKMPVSVF